MRVVPERAGIVQLWANDTGQRVDEKTCLSECTFTCYTYNSIVHYSVEPMDGYTYDGETQGTFTTQSCVLCDPITIEFKFTEIKEEKEPVEPDCPECPECPECEPCPECEECPEPELGDCQVNRLNALVGAQVIELTKKFVEIPDGQEIEFMKRLSKTLELLEIEK